MDIKNKINSGGAVLKLRKNTFIFSIVILVYNEEKNIGILLDRISQYSKKYSTEILIIDSESNDNTSKIIHEKKSLYKNIEYIRIKKSDFNYAETRNLAASLAKGKYLYFISGDALPSNTHFLERTLADFNIDNTIVCVSGKMSPKKDCDPYFALEQECFFEVFDKLTNKSGLLIAPQDNAFFKQNSLVQYFITNVFACYKLAFLRLNPFENTTMGSEDILMGKKIIQSGYAKLYDNHLTVIHSHNYSLKKYYWMQKRDLIIRYKKTGMTLSTNVGNRLLKIANMPIKLQEKLSLLFKWTFYNMVKVVALSESTIKGGRI